MDVAEDILLLPLNTYIRLIFLRKADDREAGDTLYQRALSSYVKYQVNIEIYASARERNVKQKVLRPGSGADIVLTRLKEQGFGRRLSSLADNFACFFLYFRTAFPSTQQCG